MKWRRILLLSLLFVLALGGTTWAVLQRTGAATRMLRRELAARFAAGTWIDSSELDLGAGRMSLRGIRIDDPTRAGKPLLAIAEAHADLALDPLGTLVALHAAELRGAVLDLGPQLPTLASLLRDAAGDEGGLDRLPAIRLLDGTVRFQAVAGAPAFVLGNVALELAPVRGAGRRTALLGSGTIADLGARLQVTGAFDLDAGTARIGLCLRDAVIDQGTVRWFGDRLGLDVSKVTAAGRVQSLDVVCTWAKAGTEAGVGIELASHLSGVAITAPGLPAQIRSAEVDLHASSRGQGAVTMHLVQRSADGQIDLRAEVAPLAGTPDWSVRAIGRDLKVDDDAVAALALFPLGAALGRALRPTAGRADIDLYLRNADRRGGLAEFDMQVRDVAMAYHGFGEGIHRIGFPMPLIGAHGRVRLRDDIVWLEGLQATIDPAAGGGTVALDGHIETLAASGEETTLDIRASDVRFGDHLRAALDGLLHDQGELYDRLSPTGTAAVTVLVRPQQQLAGGWSVTVAPQDATMQWTRFPLRLAGLRGTVLARANGVEFDLAGNHGPGELALRGRLPLTAASPDGVGDFAASVHLAGVAIDDDLRAAIAVLAPSLDAPWRDSGPRGRFDGVVAVWRPSPTARLRYDARLELHDIDLALPAAPWRATQLRGALIVQGEGEDSRVDFDSLRGRLDRGSGEPGELAMFGTLTRGTIAAEDLAFVVRDLRLDDQVGRTLDELGALDRDTWDHLRPSGRVDLVCNLQHTAGSAPQLQLDVHLVDVGSDAPLLPAPARHISGDLAVAEGAVTFHGVRGEIGSTVVHCKTGRVAGGDAGDDRIRIAFAVAATGFPIDGRLANLFTGPLHQAIVDRQLAGRADIDNLTLSFLVPPAGSSRLIETALEGQLRLYDVSMRLGTGPDGLRVDGINGVVSLLPSVVSEAGGGLAGAFRGGSLRIFGQPFEGIEAPFAADAVRIELSGLNSRFHGGTVAAAAGDLPAVHYLLPGPATPEGRLSANLVFERADVFSLLARSGWQNPPYTGAASGAIALERLDGTDLVGARGEGTLRIDRGDLGVVPLFTAIYAQLPAPERPRFDQMASRFRLADRRLTIDELRLGSNLLAANGRGSLDLDGYLDVEMKLDNLLGRSADPLFMPLIDFLTKNIVRFHLFGHLRDLRAEKRWVTEGSPARRAIVPMPPFQPRHALPDY